MFIKSIPAKEVKSFIAFINNYTMFSATDLGSCIVIEHIDYETCVKEEYVVEIIYTKEEYQQLKLISLEIINDDLPFK